METQNKEQEFMKEAVILAKERDLTVYSIRNLLDELKVGEQKE